MCFDFNRVERSAAARGIVLAFVLAWAATVATEGFAWVRSAMPLGAIDIDDEGYVLIAERSFLRGGALYDEVYSQYGPFYHQLLAVPARLLDVPVDYAYSRTVTGITWLAASALLALAVARSSRNTFAGALAFVLALIPFEALRTEPMHPHGLAWILFGVVAVIAAGDPRSIGARSGAAIGACVAALALTKVNLGVYVVLGAGLALAGGAREGASSRSRSIAWALAIAAVVGLVVKGGGLSILRDFGAYVAGTIAALAVVVVVPGRVASVGPRVARAALVGAIATAAVVLAVLFLDGTSLAGAVYGIFGQHSRLLVDGTGPDLPRGTLLVVLVSLACAIAWSALVRKRRDRPLLDAAIGVAALAWSIDAILSTLDCRFGDLLGRTAPFLWLAVACPMRSTWSARARPATTLASLAAFQLLQPFPGGGTHVNWAVLTLAPLAAQVLVQSIAWGRERLAQRIASLAALAVALAVVPLAWLAGYATSRMREIAISAHFQRMYSLPLDLPGDGGVRVDEAQAAFARWMVATARASDAFYSFPAYNSLYVWSEREPPTMLNITFLLQLLRVEEQQRVVEALEKAPRVAVLLDADSECSIFWSPSFAHEPIARFVRERCKPVACWSKRKLYARDGWTPPLVGCARWEGSELVLRTDGPIPGVVAALEVRALPSDALIGRTDATDATGFDLLDAERRPLDARGAFERATEVRLALQMPSRSESLALAKRPVVRALAEDGRIVRVYPVVR